MNRDGEKTFEAAVKHFQAGGVAEAARLFGKILTIEPRHADSLHLLGLIARQGRRYDVAVELIGRAIHFQPDNPHYHYNLGGAFHAQGRIKDAVAQYERAILLKPDYADAHNNLASAFVAEGKLTSAVRHYEMALAINPDHGEAHNNLGNIFKERGKLDAAMAHYQRAVEINPERAEAHYNLGIAFVAQGKVDDAVSHYERALALKPDYANAHNNLASVLQAEGRIDEAIAHFELTLAIDPNHAEAHNNLGNILKEHGRFDEAIAHYGRAVEIRPDYAEVHYNRAEIKTFRAADPELAALEELAGRSGLPDTRALHVHFALAKALDDIGDYSRSFEHLHKANTMKRRQVPYAEKTVATLFRRIANVFDTSLLDRFKGTGDPSSVPVFILGMPRSGSSLIEQILSSHPQIQGAGELTSLETAVAAVLGGRHQSLQYPECIDTIDVSTLKRLGEAYLAHLPQLAEGKLRITNKLPGNFLHIGLIRMMLPNAKIIHTMRDPIDTCASCYSKLFSSGVYFSYDLGELGRYYRRYTEMMDHWRNVLAPGDVLDVSYELVVDDIEGQARRLIDFCGLPWNDCCISFHKNSRPVRTASSVQVRKPLFRSSLQRWRRYGPGIAPLLHELGDLVPDCESVGLHAAAR